VKKKLQQYRTPDLSLWQSAVDEVVSRTSSAAAARSADSPIAIARPDQSDPMIAGANLVANTVDTSGVAPTVPKTAEVAKSVGDTVAFCATTAFKLAKAKLLGNTAEAARLSKELTVDMGPCDPKWAQVVAVYVAKKISQSNIPYRRHNQLSDFVIDKRLPNKSRVALLADWGTGDQGARLLLRQIAEKKPDVVFHLGDVYYSGTEHEFQNYFYKIWQQTLGIEKVSWGDHPSAPTTPATFTLAGNHDLYAGGVPYYKTIDMLGQPASYFCVRNDNWQFLAMDTGLHDANPVNQTEPTFLEETERTWLADKIATGGSRKNVLLSHHQLFSRFEDIGGNATNQHLLSQVQSLLPKVAAWFWGHEHNLIIYDRFEGVLGRCIGHGAFPVAKEEIKVKHAEVPVEAIALGMDSTGALFQHGYVIMDLDGASAKTTYYQFDADSQDEVELFTETL
jgi:hypothetical protein